MSQQDCDPWDGLLVLDKPAGPTSHDVVARVRRHTRVRRVGHSGTLDPPASGLMLVAIGRATRLIRFLPQQPKVYFGTLRLGTTTSTDDAQGEILYQHLGKLPTVDHVQEMARALEGRQMQVPPAVSARKVDGERMYRLARRGESVVAPAKPAMVHAFVLEPLQDGEFRYRASVSSGTYVRSLARDLGEKLGCGGHIRSLRRVSIGPIDLSGAPDPMQEAPIDAFRAAWTPLDRIPLDLATVTPAGPNEERLFRSGVALTTDRFLVQAKSPGGAAETEGTPPIYRRVVSADGPLLGVAELRDGHLRPAVVMPD